MYFYIFCFGHGVHIILIDHIKKGLLAIVPSHSQGVWGLTKLVFFFSSCEFNKMQERKGMETTELNCSSGAQPQNPTAAVLTVTPSPSAGSVGRRGGDSGASFRPYSSSPNRESWIWKWYVLVNDVPFCESHSSSPSRRQLKTVLQMENVKLLIS